VIQYLKNTQTVRSLYTKLWYFALVSQLVEEESAIEDGYSVNGRGGN
jgi:hypothetical protein